MGKNKIYCISCKYYTIPRDSIEKILPLSFCNLHHLCWNPDISIIKDTPIDTYIIAGDCLKINKKNDCKNFIKKEN